MFYFKYIRNAAFALGGCTMTSNWDTSRERLSRGEHKIKPNRELAELVDRSIFPKPTTRGGSRDKGELSGSSTVIESPAKQVAEKEKFSIKVVG